MLHDLDDIEECVARGPRTALERCLLEEFLAEKGCQLEDLGRMPIEEAKQFMREACQYASLHMEAFEAKRRPAFGVPKKTTSLLSE